MSVLQVFPPFQVFTDTDGDPLENGYIFIGQANQNPEIAPTNVFWDFALTIPAVQPIRTLGGYPSRDGTPSRLYVSVTSYSITIRDKKNQFVYSTPDVQSSTDFEARLADSIISTNGAGMVGFRETTIYPQNTVGAFLNRTRNIRQFGTIVGDGLTNDVATFQAAAASGAGIIDARGLTCKLDGQINIGSGQTWLFTGSIFNTTSTTATMFLISEKDNVALVGPFVIDGPGGATFTGAIGIRVSDSTRWRIDQPTIRNIPGYGLNFTPGSNLTGRAEHGVVLNPRIIGCNIGTLDVAGTGTEYYSMINPHVTGCYEAGLVTAAGNVNIFGGHIVDNLKDGIFMSAGSNHAHGIITGLNVNHNVRYNLITNQITNGQTFTGCHFYANNSLGAGAIFLDRSKGIILEGGHLDCWVYNDKDVNSGQNIIRDMYCPGSNGAVILSSGPNPGTDQLWFQDCYGAGAINVKTINDPYPVYVSAKRAAGSTQSLTNGVAVQLVWPVEDYDRRIAYDNTTGLFTVPAGQTGQYQICAHVITNGTAMTASASYLEIRKNGTNQTFSPGISFGVDKVVIPVEWTLDLAAGDTLSVFATISATSPVFGDSTYQSNLVIQRIS